jgi:hypothetical protein
MRMVAWSRRGLSPIHPHLEKACSWLLTSEVPATLGDRALLPETNRAADENELGLAVRLRTTLCVMWRPSTVSELQAQLASGDLEETQSFDGKRELGTDNARIAVDLCAMTVAGGVIIYGIGENASRTRLSVAAPIPLAGTRERISQIAQTSIAEPPQLEITTLEEPGRPGEGYLIVSVPPSPRAPHQISVKGKVPGSVLWAGRHRESDAYGD